MITVISSFYNESKNCESFLKMVEKSSAILSIDELVVVDNGSTDDTYKRLLNLRSSKFAILVIKNPLLSEYGDGFHAAFQKAKNDFIFMIHSDLQYDLTEYIKQNFELINSCITNKINIFPKRIKRPVFSEIKSLIYRFVLTLFYFTLFSDFNGQPKFLIKSDFSKMKSYCSNFVYDASLFLYLVKNKKNINLSTKTKERERVHGKSSWNKGMISQLKELFNNLNALKKFKNQNFFN